MGPSPPDLRRPPGNAAPARRAQCAPAGPSAPTTPSPSGPPITRTDHHDPLAATLARVVAQRGPVLARMYLPTTEQFRGDVAGFKGDKTLEQISRRLTEWHKLDDPEKRHAKESNDFKRVSTAKLLQDDAERWLRTHPDKASGSSAGLAVRELADNAKRDADRLSGKAVKRWGEGADTRVKEHVAATDMHTALGFLAPVLNAAAPTSGSKAEIEAEFELAVDPSMVGFVGMRIKLEADRQEETKLKARAELTFTAGMKVPDVGRARFELGGYLEAQGRDTTEVCQLISYALYRTMRESRTVPRWFVNKLWGGEWDQDPGYANAERWAGKIETGVMGASDAYVEIGLMAGAMAEMGFQAGAVAAKAKAQVQAGVGERWDKKSITAIHQEKSAWSDEKVAALTEVIASNPKLEVHKLYATLAEMGLNVSVTKLEGILKASGKLNKRSKAYLGQVEEIVRAASPERYRPKLGEASEFEGTFGSQEARGERTLWVKGSAEADISIATMAIKSEIALQTRGRDKTVATHMREGKIEARFGAKLPLNKALGGELLSLLKVEKAIAAILNYLRTTVTVSTDDKLSKSDKNSRKLGSGLRAGGDLASGLSQLQGIAGEPFKWAGSAKSPIEAGFGSFVTLGVVIEAKFKPSHSDGSKDSYEINFQVAEEKGLKYGADAGAFSGRMSAKTQERWLRIQIKDGVRTTDVIGITSTKPKKK